MKVGAGRKVIKHAMRAAIQVGVNPYDSYLTQAKWADIITRRTVSKLDRLKSEAEANRLMR